MAIGLPGSRVSSTPSMPRPMMPTSTACTRASAPLPTAAQATSIGAISA